MPLTKKRVPYLCPHVGLDWVLPINGDRVKDGPEFDSLAGACPPLLSGKPYVRIPLKVYLPPHAGTNKMLALAEDWWY
ncbi:hypothetical protein GCM10007383_02230 [Arenibacter certesii]|uniref:Uncharacterized protein n=1 Tax=Arenibacter certesii TaxID=228955 RepID=A0A918IMD2_9FLAO|nr:hypothetical protein GCM10007383_02230 [Arenibacter certesii]